MPELQHERGERLDFTWYETEEEIVIVRLHIHEDYKQYGTGAMSAMAARPAYNGKRMRALNVSQVVRDALLRRGWRSEGRDMIKDQEPGKEQHDEVT